MHGWLLRSIANIPIQIRIAALVANRLFVHPLAHGRVKLAMQVGLQAHFLVVWTTCEGEDRRWFAVADSIHGFTLEFETAG